MLYGDESGKWQSFYRGRYPGEELSLSLNGRNAALAAPGSKTLRTELSPLEGRVIGCLIEKEITTPDQYPLSLNALTTACNQKSNRDPVLALDKAEVQAIVDGLMKKHLVTDRSGGMGGRVTRYRHRFCNTQFGDLKFSPQETAIVCELLLRGPQTPGELRGRASRMARLHDVSEVEAALQSLAAREEPLVARLPRQPGRRESRWMQLFTGEAPAEMPDEETAATPAGAHAPPGARAPESHHGTTGDDASLERRVAELETQIERLSRRLDALAGPDETGD